MVKCIKCGAQIQDWADFCHNCGHEREKCSCGAFIDYKPNVCAECGKMTRYGLSFYQAKLDERKLKLDKRKQGLENSRLQLEEKKQQLEAEKKKVSDMKKRELEVKKFAQELGIETGLTSEEFKNNFIDKGWYIELSRPIGSMRIIVKEERKFFRERIVVPWGMVFESIEKEVIGDLRNFRVATIDELKIIYKIKDFLKDCCKLEKFEPNKCCWSSTIEKRNGAYSGYSYYGRRLDFSSGEVTKFKLDDWHGLDDAVYFLLVR